MADPYSDVSVNSYNSTPPSDDGAQTEANRVKYSTIKTKLSDPVKTAVESLNTNIGSAVDKLAGGVSSQALNYTITATDQGKIVVCTSSGTLTLDSSLEAPFTCGVNNQSGSTITISASTGNVDGETSITLPDRCGFMVSFDSTDWFTSGRGISEGDNTTSFNTPLPRNYIDGLVLSNNVTDSDHDLDIAVGVCRDFGNSFNLELSSAFTKRIDATWSAGTGNGGRASTLSLSAGQWYHVYAIGDTSGNLDFGFDNSATAANLLSDSGYTLYRLLGSIQTDTSSNIRAFTQIGNYFLWDNSRSGHTSTSIPTSKTNFSVLTPSGRQTMAHVRVEIGAAPSATSVYVFHGDHADAAPSGSGVPQTGRDLYVDGTNDTVSSVEMLRYTNTSSQLAYRANTAGGDIGVRTIGWYEPTLR